MVVFKYLYLKGSDVFKLDQIKGFLAWNSIVCIIQLLKMVFNFKLVMNFLASRMVLGSRKTPRVIVSLICALQ